MRRLAAIDGVLDGRGKELADVAISVVDDRGYVSALELRDGYAYVGWFPRDLQVESQSGHGDGAVPGPGRPGAWEDRLRVIGRLLDREPVPPRDVCVLEVNDGVVVAGLSPVADGDRLVWRLGSREFAADAIAAATDASRRSR